MSIRTKLLINILLLVSSLVITGIVLNIARDKVRDAVATGASADQIVIGVSDMNTITYDYLMKPGGRARQQWEMKHASLDNLIRGAIFEGEKESVILTRIMKNHEDTALFFKQLVENDEKKKHSAASMRALLAENNERNVTQLMARSQIMAGDAYSLSRESDASIQKALTWSVWFITVTLVIMIVIAGAISYFLSRNITESIKTLKNGTEIIARGDLEYRVPVRGRDEIASLSHSFNEMAERLKDTDGSLRAEIEEKEKAREALRIANLYTRSLIEVSLDPLVTISAEGRVMDVNKATEDVTGVPREKLVGSDFSDYFTEPDKAREGYSRVFSHGFVKDYPLAIRHTSGEITEVLYNAATYKNDKGEVQGVFAAARDVTALSAAQRALQQSYDELEHRVEERTAELKERTVQLEAANKELEGFSYSVSHDLRAPLRAIDGFSLRLIRDFGDKLEEDGVRKLHAISRNAQQMGQLIDDLLSFSRLSRKEMHMSRVNMEAVARDVWNEIKELNPDRELDFKIVNMIPLFGDTSLIRQVVVNLLSNAVKFTRDRKPAVIEIGSRNEGSEITYYVKDNGAGFDMRYSDKLFGVFERLHRPDEFEGTGVGLAIVQRIIHRHGGRVWAEGKVNGGAMFSFTIAGRERNIA